MRWKQTLTPLEDVPELDVEVRDVLIDHSITTAEELVGQIESEPAAVGALLGMDDAHVSALHDRAFSVIGDDVAAAMDAQRGRTHSLGALPPTDA